MAGFLHQERDRGGKLRSRTCYILSPVNAYDFTLRPSFGLKRVQETHLTQKGERKKERLGRCEGGEPAAEAQRSHLRALHLKTSIAAARKSRSRSGARCFANATHEMSALGQSAP